MYQPTGLPVLLMIFLPFRCAFAQTTQISVDWTFETSGRVYSTPVVEGNMVYFGSGDHLIYAVDIRTGNEEWSYRTEGEVHATPAIDGDRIFISSADGKLYCLDKNKGPVLEAMDFVEAVRVRLETANGSDRLETVVCCVGDWKDALPDSRLKINRI